MILTEVEPFTIESFYKFLCEKKLMAAKCNICGVLLIPPRPVCTRCLSKKFRWVELQKKGKLLTYTVIHISPSQFQSITPYAIGIVKLEDDLNLPGMIRGIKPGEIKIGMSLELNIEITSPSKWPFWPRYFFSPPISTIRQST